MKSITLMRYALVVLAILLLYQCSFKEKELNAAQSKLSSAIEIGLLSENPLMLVNFSKEPLISKYDPEKLRNERMNILIIQKKTLLAAQNIPTTKVLPCQQLSGSQSILCPFPQSSVI